MAEDTRESTRPAPNLEITTPDTLGLPDTCPKCGYEFNHQTRPWVLTWPNDEAASHAMMRCQCSRCGYLELVPPLDRQPGR